MVGRTNVGGGGIAVSAWAYIGVTYPSGSICTATNGTLTFTAADTSGLYVFQIPEPSGSSESWTVSCTDGTHNKSVTVTINTHYQTATVTLRYSRLPEGYQEVEYLESSFGQRIITGFNSIGDNEEVQLDYMMLEDLEHSVFGLCYGYAQIQGLGASRYGETFNYAWKNANVNSNATIGTKMTAVINRNHSIVENNQTLVSNLESPLVINTPIPLFCQRDYEGDYGFINSGATRIYKWIRTNTTTNTVVENLVPCYRTNDNVAGMIDLVSGTFRVNSGSGTFVVGPDV